MPLKTLFKIKIQNFSFLPQPLSTCNIVVFKHAIYSPQAWGYFLNKYRLSQVPRPLRHNLALATHWLTNPPTWFSCQLSASRPSHCDPVSENKSSQSSPLPVARHQELVDECLLWPTTSTPGPTQYLYLGWQEVHPCQVTHKMLGDAVNRGNQEESSSNQ